METKQPTKKQLRKFWEWCDCLEIKQFPKIGVSDFPNPDLNNLLKYAVPAVINTEWVSLEYHASHGYSLFLARTTSHCECHISSHYLGDKHYSASNKDPALALFWAIWQVVEEEEKAGGYRHTSIGDNIRDGFS